MLEFDQQRLADDIAAAGVAAGTTLIVHSSLSSIGRVAGGAPTVIRALLAVLGPRGTLAMPAATPQCAADPEGAAPLFDRRTTPTSLGAIPEAFRTWPGTLRSDHPLESVCARGPLAPEITREHPRAFSEGPGSPFARLHELDSRILLLGVGFNRCTALHFAESLVERRRTTTVRFAVLRDGRRSVVEVPNVADDNDTLFPVIGDRYVAAGHTAPVRIGEARCYCFPLRGLVEFARAFLTREL